MPKHTASDGTELNYETLGEPSAPYKVVFIMGLSGSHKAWGFQTPYFSSLPDYQMLIFDNRGCGHSQSPPGPYTMLRMAQDTLELATVAGFEKFHCVGVSMGGMIAHHVALQAPERILSLSLIVTRTEGNFLARTPTLPGVWQFLKMSRAKDMDAILECALDLIFPNEFLSTVLPDGKTTYRDAMRDNIKDYNAGMPVQSKPARDAQLSAISGHGLNAHQIAQLRGADFPILAITGDRDILVRPTNSYAMPDLLGADLLIVEGAGHGVNQQSHALVNHALREHFEQAAAKTEAAKTGQKKPPQTRTVHWQVDPQKREVGQHSKVAAEAELQGIAEPMAMASVPQ